MAVARGPFLAAVLLLAFSGHHCASLPPDCPESCTCQADPTRLDCSSTGLSLVPQHIRDSVTELDLAHNHLQSVTLDRPFHNLRAVWLGNNSITHLSLCIERTRRGRRLYRMKPWSRLGCESWAPTLQLLSAEKNQLVQFPEGVEGSKFLQVLQLSFNRISTLQPGHLKHLRQLTELHLQHNLITSLHPQTFLDLTQLQVLDLSFNMLTSLEPLMYLSLRKFGTDVTLDGNKWQCDCSMRSVRRRMLYDSNRGLQAWSMECASPSNLSGRELLRVEENELNCFSMENADDLLQDVTVHRGSEILLTCSAQDSTSWMPSGQVSTSHPQAGLLITDFTEDNKGLYVCISDKDEVVSLFNLQISRIEGVKRKTRSLPSTSQKISQDILDRAGQDRIQRATQCNLALAVCLSVFITFLIAFIIGVLMRPYIDILWRRITKKNSSPATNTASVAEQRQYDNEAFTHYEDVQGISNHRERRVTFSSVDIKESSNVDYYDRVTSGNNKRINNHTVIKGDKAERNTQRAGDSGSENSSRRSSQEENQRVGRDLSGTTGAGRTHNREFERIPNPDELGKRRSSSSSDSSLSNKVCNEGQVSFPQVAVESVQQKAHLWKGRTVPQFPEDGSERLGFSSEPFADWSPHAKKPSLTDPDMWQQNEEQFEFSDSIRTISGSSSGVSGSFDDSKQIVAPALDIRKRSDAFSSSSNSENESTEYTVNADQDENIERNHNKPEVRKDFSFQQWTQGGQSVMISAEYNQGNGRYDSQTGMRTKHSFSSHSSDSDEEKDNSNVTNKPNSHRATGEIEYMQKIKPMPRTKFPGSRLVVSSHGNTLDTQLPSPPAAYSSSSSSESELENSYIKGKQKRRRVIQGTKIFDSEKLSTSRDVQSVPKGDTTRYNDIKAVSPAIDSSSTSESEVEIIRHTVQKGRGKVNIVGLPFQESEAESLDLVIQWPVLNLEHTTWIKRRLDIKVTLPQSDSSSSSSDREHKRSHTRKHEQWQANMTRVPIKVPQTVGYDPHTHWPAIDHANTIRIKRRLDIKIQSPQSDSSSSSDSEDETSYMKKQEQWQTSMTRVPVKVSQKVGYESHRQWPAVDLENTTRIKRRLDIKVQSPQSDSSSSSDIEDETSHMKKQEQWQTSMTRVPVKEPQIVDRDRYAHWPAMDLANTTRIKRRLDIKIQSPQSDSSSSSDSEDETSHMKKQEQWQTSTTRVPVKEPQNVDRDRYAHWPAIDLKNTTRIKRRMDINVPSPPSDSSSSSDSEVETSYMKKQEQWQTSMTRVPVKVSQTVGYESHRQWPAVDLANTTWIKRRLDIKVQSPQSDSSSSSDSEDETSYMKKQEQWQTSTTRVPVKVPQTVGYEPYAQWPAIDLENTTRIKRRMDIKVPLPQSDSSSSSDSEVETSHMKKQEQWQTSMTRVPVKVSQTVGYESHRQWPAVDLANTTWIKRRLDIKVQSPQSDSSSSSDSEDETGHMKKQEQWQTSTTRVPVKEPQNVDRDRYAHWPAIDLKNTTRIKRRMDIKVPSPKSASSSSSDSEVETSHMKKREQWQTSMTRVPVKVSQTVGYESHRQWPAVDLANTTWIKRRLDIKVQSPQSDSSSSSDSEDETSHMKKQEQWQTSTTRVPVKEPQNVDRDRYAHWPAIDLKNTTRIKRRLDIKVPSPKSASSSSSSDSEVETSHMKKREQWQTSMTRVPVKVSQTVGYESHRQWPAVDLANTTWIKRRLDIKVESPQSDSSSSSDSEDETSHMKKQEQWQTSTTRVPVKVPQTVGYEPYAQWPAIDLENTTRIKRRLDINVPSPPSDSSSSSDSEVETSHMKKQEQWQTSMTRVPVKVSQTVGYESHRQWPAVDLANTTWIKRRLDIKVESPQSDSSSSSDSEDETSHMKKQEQWQTSTTRVPVKVPQTVGYEPYAQWPAIDLENTTRIKRRLDINVPSPPSDSSSSSDSEVETSHMKKQEQWQTSMTRVPVKVSQTVGYESHRQWPAVDLANTTWIKRRLDIKVQSPQSDSSSSSDSEDETSHMKKQEQWQTSTTRVPVKVPQTVGYEPYAQWPAIDLENTTRIKRRMDIKVPLPPSDSSSSSDSEDETSHIKKQEQWQASMTRVPVKVSQTVGYESHRQWPAVDLANTTWIKRRLDIKVQSPQSDSSSSSDSEDETSHMKKQEQWQTSTTRVPVKVAQTVGYDPYAQWPAIDLENTTRIKRRLDINVPLPQSDSSSSSDSEDETSHMKKQEQWQTSMTRVPVKVSQTVGHDPSPVSDSSSSIDTEAENRDHAKLGLGASATSKTTEKDFIRIFKTPLIYTFNTPKTDQSIKLEKYTVITDDMGNKTSDNSDRTPEINPELESRWAKMNLGISRFRKRLEITAHKHDSSNTPSSPPPDSPSSSGSDKMTGSKYSRTRQRRGEAGIQGIKYTPSFTFEEKFQDDKSGNSAEKLRKDNGSFSDSSSSSENEDAEYVGNRTEVKSQSHVTEKKASQIHPSPKVAQTVSINMDQPQSQSQNVERKAEVELKMQASKMREEREVSFDSNTENDTIDHNMAKISLGVPYIKRQLNIKAPVPAPNHSPSSSSESENEGTGHTTNQKSDPSDILGGTETDSVITYKRSIFSSTSPLSNSLPINHAPQTENEILTAEPESPSHRVRSRNASLALKTLPIMSLVQSKTPTLAEVPPEIRWNGIGHQLSDFSISSPRSNDIATPRRELPAKPELLPFYLSSERGYKIQEGRGKRDETLMPRHSTYHVSNDYFASNRALDNYENSTTDSNQIMSIVSDNRRERKGLNALKAMSSERSKWDIYNESPQFDGANSQVTVGLNNQSFEENIEPLPKEPQTPLHLHSPPVDEREAQDFLYGIPRYRRHVIGGMRPQEAPPPIPASPPPYEAVMLTLNAPQSSEKQGLKGTYLQQSRNRDPSLMSQHTSEYIDSPYITHV